MQYISAVILGFLLVVSPPVMADETEDPTGVSALLCKMSGHGQVLTQTLSIDYDNKLVNGMSATFSPSLISWTTENGSKAEHYELNRITGSYYSWIDKETSVDLMSVFTCEKALKKF